MLGKWGYRAKLYEAFDRIGQKPEYILVQGAVIVYPYFSIVINSRKKHCNYTSNALVTLTRGL